MKLIDLHCDTITMLAHRNAHLRENDMHIDLMKLKKADQLAQCFAIFVHRKISWDDLEKITHKNALRVFA